LLHSSCEDIFRQLEDNSIDAIITDPPYVVSDESTTGGEEEIANLGHRRAIQRNMGKWDEEFDPDFLIEQAARVLVPGGWLVVFSGDSMFGKYHDGIKHRCDEQGHNLFAYKWTVTWHRTNAAPHIRKTNFVSTNEFIKAGIKLDDGKKIKPISWNWLGQRNMANFIQGPNCMGRERLYWHTDDHGVIYPCIQYNHCHWCGSRGKDDRRRHPTQKPLYLWEHLYKILTKPGMKVFDPYAGLGSSGIAAKKYGLDWFGSEISEEYATAGQMWASGRWRPRSDEQLDLL